MTRPIVLVARAAPGLPASLAALARLGYDAIAAPTSDIIFEPVDPPLPESAVLVFTSASAPAALDMEAAPRGARVFAVGPATAEAARTAGWTRIETGAGDAADLAGLIAAHLKPGEAPVVHVRGADAAFDVAAALRGRGFEAETRIVYRAPARESLGAEAEAALKAGGARAVLLYSRRGAEAFYAQCARAGLETAAAALPAAVMSPSVRDALEASVRAEIADAPREPALFEALSRIVAPD